jgi:ribosomal protein S17
MPKRILEGVVVSDKGDKTVMRQKAPKQTAAKA